MSSWLEGTRVIRLLNYAPNHLLRGVLHQGGRTSLVTQAEYGGRLQCSLESFKVLLLGVDLEKHGVVWLNKQVSGEMMVATIRTQRK